MRWLLITEEKIPNDNELISRSYEMDIDSKKYAPTVGFAKKAFDMLNSNLFSSKLPTKRMIFKVKSFPESIKNALGYVVQKKQGTSGNIWNYVMTLNSNVNLTIHRWFETVLHEMIHVYEDEFYPDNQKQPNYDPHGEWFVAQCNRVKRYGFDISTTYKGDFDMDNDSMTVKKMKSKYIYIQTNLDCWKNRSADPILIKIYKTEKEKWFQLMYFNGINATAIWSTENANATELAAVKFPFGRSKHCKGQLVKPLQITDAYNNRYGPFVKTGDDIDIEEYFDMTENGEGEPITEENQHPAEENQHPNDDEYMAEIRRRYGDSLVFVRKTATGYSYAIM